MKGEQQSRHSFVWQLYSYQEFSWIQIVYDVFCFCGKPIANQNVAILNVNNRTSRNFIELIDHFCFATKRICLSASIQRKKVFWCSFFLSCCRFTLVMLRAYWKCDLWRQQNCSSLSIRVYTEQTHVNKMNAVKKRCNRQIWRKIWYLRGKFVPISCGCYEAFIKQNDC